MTDTSASLVALPWLPADAEPAPGEDALLAAGGRAWLLEEGTVELFLVLTAPERQTARWTSLTSLEPGALVVTVAPAEERALLLRLSPDARLRAVDPEAGAEREAVVAGAERWLEQTLAAVGSRVGEHELHPLRRRTRRRDGGLQLTPLPADGEAVELPPGALARTEAPLAWVTVAHGSVRLLGRERGRVLAPSAPAVLGDGDWLLPESEAAVRAGTTAELAAEGELVEALEGHAHELLAILARRVETVERREQRLLREREQLDEATLEVAMRDFAAILDARVGRLGGMAESAAFTAVRHVGDHLGVTIRGPAASAEGGSRTDIVSAIAHASRMRTREIELSGRWWRRDLGPLVGFTDDDDETPVALIPGRRGYRMHDPRTGEVVRVDRRTAAAVGSTAREFYRPLPERPVERTDLVRYALGGSRADLTVLGFSALGFAVVGLLVPILTGTILGTLVPRAESDAITQLCILLMLSASVSTLFATAFNIAGLRMEGRLDSHFQAGIWDRLMALPPRFFRGYSTGELATAALGVSEAREVLSGVAFKAVLATVVAVTNVVLIAVYDLRLALLTLVVVALFAVVSVLVGLRQIRHQRAVFDATEEVNSRTYQLLSGVAKVNTAAAEARAFAHWAEAFGAARRHIFAARNGQNGLTAFNATANLVGAAAAFLVVDGVVSGIDQGTYLVFNIAFFQILASLLQISATAMLAIQIVPPLRALAPILEAVPEATSTRADPGRLQGGLEVSGVGFSYGDPGEPALEDVSFSVAPGEFVAIVGPSGCGKSTLLRLLLAFEEPATGAIAYDGQDLADLDPIAVRRQCGVVLQDATLFAGDIFSNIVGSGLYTYDDAWRAIEMCGMDKEIADLPMGMYTMLSDGGGSLSGGQQQRLLLARAMVARPRILFLDEATSALDNRSQEVVTESMRALQATRVVIAHRLSTIRDADRIVVLDGGRIVQTGTYDELMEQEGMFQTLARRQLA